MLYEAQDGRYVQFNMVRSPEQLEVMLEVLGLEALLDDERFATPEDRFENGSALAARVRDAISLRPAAEWLSLFQSRGVPATPVALVEEMVEDEQAIANDVLMRPADPALGMPYVINHPIGLGDVRGRGPARPPEVGEHCDEVLAELGYGQEEIDRLRREGVL